MNISRNINYFLTGEAKRGTDESEFNLILSSRSFLHLCRVMDEYERLRGHSLEKAIKAEFSGIAVVAMNAICNYSYFIAFVLTYSLFPNSQCSSGT